MSNPLQAIKSALSILKEGASKNVNDMIESDKKYGPVLSMQYEMSGGKPRKNTADPLNIARSKMALRQDLTPKEKQLIQSSGLAKMAGITQPVQELTPGTRGFQDLSNEVFQLGLKNKQNFMKNGQIDLQGMSRVEELANKYLSKQAMNVVKKNNSVGNRIGAYLDELAVLTQH